MTNNNKGEIKQIIQLESLLIPNNSEQDRYNFGIADVLVNGCGKFSKMIALADRQIPQGSIKWSSRLTSNNGGNIGASQMLNIVGENYDIKEFFSKTMNRSDIPPLNSNWSNLIEEVTTRFAEMSRKLKIFDGVTMVGPNMSSCTVDGFSLIGDGGLQIWEFKSVIFRYLRHFGSIHFRYIEQVEAQKTITNCDKSTYFKMKLVPCTIEQMLNPNISKYQSFLNKRGIKVESPKAYGYIKIESNGHFLHKQYCNDSIIDDICNCEHKEIPPREMALLEQDEVARIMGLVKGGNWRSSFELVIELTDKFIDKMNKESCEYIMPFVIMNTNSVTSCTNKDLILLYGDRLIVAASILKNFYAVVGKRFDYKWPDEFLDYVTELYESNLKLFHMGKAIRELEKEKIFKFIRPIFEN